MTLTLTLTLTLTQGGDLALHIAAHVRRGDLAARDPNRLVSNEEVGAALAELAKANPNPDRIPKPKPNPHLPPNPNQVGAALAELAEVVAELRSGDATHGGLRLAATVHIMSEGRPTDFPVRLWAASLRRHNVSHALHLLT